MAELKTIEDVKKEIGNKVKFGTQDNMSENLKSLDVLEGTITKLTSSWEHTVDGDTCVSWTASVDVVDPKDGGLHHLTATRIFDLDEKDDNIINIKVTEEIATLDARIAELEAKMVYRVEDVIEEPLEEPIK